jgi:hypothetical protein
VTVDTIRAAKAQREPRGSLTTDAKDLHWVRECLSVPCRLKNFSILILLSQQRPLSKLTKNCTGPRSPTPSWRSNRMAERANASPTAHDLLCRGWFVTHGNRLTCGWGRFRAIASTSKGIDNADTAANATAGSDWPPSAIILQAHLASRAPHRTALCSIPSPAASGSRQAAEQEANHRPCIHDCSWDFPARNFQIRTALLGISELFPGQFRYICKFPMGHNVGQKSVLIGELQHDRVSVTQR